MAFNKRDNMPFATAQAIYDRRLDGASWDEISEEFDIYYLAAKAALEKHGFNCSGSNMPEVELWERPCLKCKLPERRRKWLFLCKACRKENRDEYRASDSMYHSGGALSGVPR